MEKKVRKLVVTRNNYAKVLCVILLPAVTTNVDFCLYCLTFRVSSQGLQKLDRRAGSIIYVEIHGTSLVLPPSGRFTKNIIEKNFFPILFTFLTRERPGGNVDTINCKEWKAQVSSYR